MKLHFARSPYASYLVRHSDSRSKIQGAPDTTARGRNGICWKEKGVLSKRAGKHELSNAPERVYAEGVENPETISAFEYARHCHIRIDVDSNIG
jgi:hypothetical protein